MLPPPANLPKLDVNSVTNTIHMNMPAQQKGQRGILAQGAVAPSILPRIR